MNAQLRDHPRTEAGRDGVTVVAMLEHLLGERERRSRFAALREAMTATPLPF